MVTIPCESERLHIPACRSSGGCEFIINAISDPNAIIVAEKDGMQYTGVADENGECSLTVAESGVYTVIAYDEYSEPIAAATVYVHSDFGVDLRSEPTPIYAIVPTVKTEIGTTGYLWAQVQGDEEVRFICFKDATYTALGMASHTSSATLCQFYRGDGYTVNAWLSAYNDYQVKRWLDTGGWLLDINMALADIYGYVEVESVYSVTDDMILHYTFGV